MFTWRKVTVFTLVIALFSLILSGLASAQQIQESDGQTQVVSIRASSVEIATTQELWTREAMLAAQPIVPPPLTTGDFGEGEVQGPPGAIGGSRPMDRVGQQARAEFPEEWAILDAFDAEMLKEQLDNGVLDGAPEGTAGIFDSYQENRNTSYPFQAVGRLFFTTPSGSSSCTASVISPNNIIVTAAHCAYDTVSNRWYSNWSFAPGYRNGARPYGTFPWQQAWVLNGWINASGTVRRYDVAVIKLRNNSSGRPVTYYTGSLGRSWNYGSVQHHFSYGYPSNIGSSQYLQTCAAESFSSGTDVLGMGCNMTYGSSGGPWIRVHKPYFQSSTNYVNSVVSGGTPPAPTFYGPRFSSDNIVPLCTTAGC
jgi:V8-like Glu-specific endopeptidase